jgi:hypothetical protein
MKITHSIFDSLSNDLLGYYASEWDSSEAP